MLYPETSDLARYETDVLGRRTGALFVARPKTTPGVQSVLRWAFRNRVRLVVQGANTGPVSASTPDPMLAMGVLSLERLKERLEVDRENRSVTVSAGVDLASLNSELATYGLTLPIDLGANPSIGGMVAANTGGARLIRYGDVRHHLLGLEVVLADPDTSVLSLLGGLRKDNRGPDLKQWFVGSSGTLGVITAATLSLHQMQRCAATAFVLPGGEDAVIDLLMLLEAEAGDWLSAFEMLSAPVLEAIRSKPQGGVRWPFQGDTPPMALLVELASSRSESAAGVGASGADGSDWLAETLAGILEKAVASGLADEAWFGPPSDCWAIRHAAIGALQASGHVQAFDLAVARGQVFALRQALQSLVARIAPAATYADFGHVGDGGLHVILLWPRDSGSDAPGSVVKAEDLRSVSDGIYEAVLAMGGTFSAEHGLGRDNEAVARRSSALVHRRLLAAMKAVCDPEGILGGFNLLA